MPRLKKTEEDIKKQGVIAQQWIDFRLNNLFTQKKLAEILGLGHQDNGRSGVRTIQMIESGRVMPHPGTMKKFDTLVAKYKAAKAIQI